MKAVLNGDKPLYSQINQILRERIQSGRYAPNQQLPTEVELAEQFGVSRITSKRALIELEREGLIYRRRGSGSFVKKIEERPSPPSGETAATAAGRIVSMIIPYVASNRMVGYIPGVAEYLESRGYYLSIHSSDWRSERECEFLRTLPRRGISGIILYPVSTQRNMEIVHALHTNGYPIVTVDQYYANIDTGSVVSDNYGGGCLAASKLVELGHTRIAFLSTIAIQYRSSVRDRFLGYCKALSDGGIPLDVDLVFSDLPPEAEGEPGARKAFYKELLMKMRALGVTAIQAEHDMVAYDCVKAAQELGMRIPDELSIVGFDNNQDLASHADVTVASIEQDCYEIGRRAAIHIVRQLESGERSREHDLVPVKWVRGGSIGPGEPAEARDRARSGADGADGAE